MLSKEIRETFLHFFEERGHRRVASGPLVPEADPTLLFTNAGMVQFKRVFLGEESRPYKTATTSQKCMRVSGKHNDLENVGRTPRHLTFFEMLGNFSFGDYFKEKAIEYAWELVTRRFELPEDKLVVSVFREDDEAFDLWRDRIGLPEEKIYRLDEKENFWSMGDTGPCGPCTEIHCDFGPVPGFDADDPSSDSGRFIEIWNLVFMQFDRSADGKMTPLPSPCVDTGAGLERLAAVIQGQPSVYDTDAFRPMIVRAQEIAGVERGADPERDVSLNVIADHARALTFLIGDGVLPSNEGRGYVLRRILRRAARHGWLLGIERPFLHQVADAVIEEMKGAYPELVERRAFIKDRIEREEGRFLETLAKGMALLDEAIEGLRGAAADTLPGDAVFKLYDTYGFPVDLTADILSGHGIGIDQSGFDTAMEAQRSRARAAWKGSGAQRVDQVYGRMAADLSTTFQGYDTLVSTSRIRGLLVGGKLCDEVGEGDEVEVVVEETPFYAESGGQVGDRGRIATESGLVEVLDTLRPAGELVVHRGKVAHGRVRVDQEAKLEVDAEARAATVRNHSGTHLLHAALRRVLGEQAMQKGSLVAPDRLRFDFTHDAPLTAGEIKQIEDLANRWVETNSPGRVQEMAYPEAIASGAVAIFEEKYGDHVRVISFGDFSTELCGGTHAAGSGEIGMLKIVAETGIAAGVRRIEALTGIGALEHVQRQEATLQALADRFKTGVPDLEARVDRLLEERRNLERELEKLRREARGAASSDLTAAAREVSGTRLLMTRVEGVDGKQLRPMVDELRDKLGSGIVLLAAEKEDGVSLALGVTEDLTARFKAGDLIREVAAVVGGKGGGRPDFAQAGGRDVAKLDEAFARLEALVVDGGQ
ncbi:MAG: alanine--tRNA ligase [Myxococcota bacterium]|jgi:alanyl-tRNA synthetase|nr:alanine--tRNA ligase [Deltaproteobacteria bacterium]MCP4240966.1 alanine--tRNA ligase [bacterium]MDP6074971.1 alanine--tRNA ligase [Myxococcota bacterium]MCP4906757.1 alanine--tRNA ligase [bacterium]MDP6243095.1 alanine--tRNA ligase [Myxococcota bacterium]